jgi:homoserine kinase
MATTASNGIPAPNYQYGQAFNKITSVPLVKESLDAAHSTIESHPILAQPFHFGENVVSHGLKAAEPVTTRLQPQLSLLDAYAVKGLDFAESKWAYPFKATSSDVYKNARQPADQVLSILAAYSQAVHKAYEDKVIGPAKSIYESRVAPAVDSANAQFQELKSQNAYLHRADEPGKDRRIDWRERKGGRRSSCTQGPESFERHFC